MGLREEARGRLVLQGGERDVRVIPPAEPLGPRLDEGADKRPVLVGGRATGRRVLLELDGQVGSLLELRTEVEERTQAEGAQRTQKMRCPGSRGGHAGGYAVALAVPAWQAGHQYAVRAWSPCGRDRMRPSHRRHGSPARR